MRGWLKARILSPLPETVDGDLVYIQVAVLEMPDGKRIYAFDPDMLSEPHMIDTVREVVLNSTESDVTKLDEPAFGIAPDPDRDYHNCTFYGLIEEKIECQYDDEFILNTGYGKIWVHIHSVKESLNTGDFVNVIASRLDLEAISRDDGRIFGDRFRI